jgi:hypothetical protein
MPPTTWRVCLRCVIESLNNSRHVVGLLGRWTNARFSEFGSVDNETQTRHGVASRKLDNSAVPLELLPALLQHGVNVVRLRSTFQSDMYFPTSRSPALLSDHHGTVGTLRRCVASTEGPGTMW